jgi:DNA-binding beta-propeller fold protein YncE
VNQGSNGVVIYFDPGTPAQHTEARVDRYAEHFMSMVSGIAFGTSNHFATCQESRNPWYFHPQAPDDDMGPTLWTADLAIFATVGQAFPHEKGTPEGSHIDMLHESPLCMGIAHQENNVYWAFDGLNGHIVRYDFAKDHGPGGTAHSNGRVRRYVEATVTRMENVASQLAFDSSSGQLYIADTGAGRITRLDTRSGNVSPTMTPPQMEPLAEYSRVTGTRYDVLVAGLGHPSGLILWGGRLYFSNVDNGDIVSLDLTGRELGRIATRARSIMGLTIGPDGKLYYVDPDANIVTRVDP